MCEGRARKGGEIGRNGEFYKGGTFLPSTQLPKRGSRAKSGKCGLGSQIEPGVFVERISTDVCSIFVMISGVYGCVNSDGLMEPRPNLPHTAKYSGFTEEEIRCAMAAYNAGARWVGRRGYSRFYLADGTEFDASRLSTDDLIRIRMRAHVRYENRCLARELGFTWDQDDKYWWKDYSPQQIEECRGCLPFDVSKVFEY